MEPPYAELVHEPGVRDQLIVEALRRGQTVRLRATSRSMAPSILPGDLLLVHNEKLSPGDVALYWHQGAWVTHRIVGVRNGAYDVRADAPECHSEHIALGQMVGRVVAVRRSWLSVRYTIGRALDRVFGRLRDLVRLRRQP
jgi:phage repressor protein C with HTH and peptisase S24 domain